MMHRLTSFLFVIMLIGGSYSSAHAQNQTDASITGQGSLSFGLGIPTGDFNENTNNLGYGGNVYIGAEFPNSPVGVGLDFSVFAFGRSTRNVPFSETVGGAVRVDVITTNTIVQPHLVLRLQPRDGLVRPYAEGLFGFKYLFTDTRVQDERREDETIASSRNFDDFALSAGGAAGVHIRVAQGNPGSQQNSFRAIYVKLGLQYMWGREAEYLDISDGYDPDNPQVRQSNTTMLIPMIGVALQF
jgi:hypothetical protein